MALPAGQIVAQNAYLSLYNTLDSMNYAGQAPSTVRSFSAEQHALIQAQLIASGLVTVQVIGVTAGTTTIPATGIIT